MELPSSDSSIHSILTYMSQYLCMRQSFTCLAGLWLEDMNYSLIWQCCDQGMRNKDYTVPSWIWASMTFKILEPTFFSINGYIYREPGWKYDAKIISHNINTTSRGPFGQVESGHLRIRGYWRHVDRFADSPIPFFEHVADRRFLYHRSRARDMISSRSRELLPRSYVVTILCQELTDMVQTYSVLGNIY